MIINLSNNNIETSKAEDNRKWIAPHIPISLSSTDYFNGNDKAFNVILEVIKSNL